MRLSRLGILFLALWVIPSLAQWEYFDTSLHKTRAGKETWYGAANGGFEAFTGVPIEDLGCVGCHGATDADGNPYSDPYTPDCGDCHPSSFLPVAQEQCLSCHGRQAKEIALGYSDVHRDMGMVCWDCHSMYDIHGDGTEYASMLEPGAIDADCENCHTNEPAHDSYDPHDGALHCTACHAQTVLSCYNCHFESQVQAHVKRAKQPLHDFVILGNRKATRDGVGQVYPMTFQSLTNDGTAFAAFGPFTSHTITLNGRTCDDCHYNYGPGNAAIEEYNNTGEIKFATWDDGSHTLSWIHGVIPMPSDYETAWRMDFLTYTGDPSDPPPGDAALWTGIGKDQWDGHQMFYIDPLTETQMAAIGMSAPVGVPEQGEFLKMLRAANPNPFRDMTRFSFALPEAMDVTLSVYDIQGRLVEKLMDGQKDEGSHEVIWSAKGLSAGVYLCQLKAGQYEETLRVVLVK